MIGKLIEQGVRIAGQRVRLRKTGDQQRKRLVLLARFDLVDLLDGVQVDRVDGQTVERVSRQSDDTAFTQAGDDVIDPVRLGFVGMDA